MGPISTAPKFACEWGRPSQDGGLEEPQPEIEIPEHLRPILARLDGGQRRVSPLSRISTQLSISPYWVTLSRQARRAGSRAKRVERPPPMPRWVPSTGHPAKRRGLPVTPRTGPASRSPTVG